MAAFAQFWGVDSVGRLWTIEAVVALWGIVAWLGIRALRQRYPPLIAAQDNGDDRATSGDKSAVI